MLETNLFETSSELSKFLVGLGFSQNNLEMGHSYKLDKSLIKGLIYGKEFESESWVYNNFIAKILGYKNWDELQLLGIEETYNKSLEKGLVSKLENLVNNRDVYVFASVIHNLTLYQKR